MLASLFVYTEMLLMLSKNLKSLKNATFELTQKFLTSSMNVHTLKE